MNLASASDRSRHLIAYFVLTYLISWSIEIPLALSYQHVLSVRLPFALHYLAPFGPLLSAAIVTLATEGPSGLFRLLRRLTPPTSLVKGGNNVNTPRTSLGTIIRPLPEADAQSNTPLSRASSLARRGEGRRGDSSVYFVFAIVAPAAIFALISLATAVLRGAWPNLRSLGHPDYLPEIGILPTLILWLLTYGLGEEVGWRGYALPRLQAERPALSASLILGAFWAAWHLPALFYRDTYIAMGLLVIPMLLTVAAVGSVVYTWLFNGTGGNLLLLVLFHGLFDFFSVWEGGIIGAGPVMTVCMVFWAVRVFKLYGPATLSPTEKVVA